MKYSISKSVLNKYSGMHVAIVNGRVVAARDDISKALDIARKKYFFWIMISCM